MNATPRVTTIRVELPANEELWITPLSDLHADGSAFDLDGFRLLMRERNKHPHHRAFILGDAMDLVVPTDLRRWRASAQDASLSGRDDWTNAAVDVVGERLTADGTVYDGIGPGNHEDEFLKRHGVDVTSMLARELRCARLGYSGIIQYVIETKSKESGKVKNRAPVFRILYHHGAWGGRVMKGFGGARDFERAFYGHQIMVYGHNHQATVHRESRFRVGKNGAMIEEPHYIVCTGSWVESYSEDAKITHYAERAGYMPTSRITPLIRVRVRKVRNGKSATWGLGYTVEM